MFPALDPGTALAPRYWSWNGGPREGRGVEAMEKGGQIVGAGGAGGGWECLGTPWKPELRTWGGDIYRYLPSDFSIGLVTNINHLLGYPTLTYSHMELNGTWGGDRCPKFPLVG